MIGKMLFHSAVAAILIASAALVYAEAKDSEPSQLTPVQTETKAQRPEKSDTGYLKPTAENPNKGHKQDDDDDDDD